MRRLVKISAAAAATVAVAIAIGFSIGGADFARQHLGAIVVAVAFALGLGTAAYHLIRGLVRGAVTAVQRPRELGQSGAAATEFVIVVIPFLLTMFGVMQMAMASMARVLVSYSAFCAARAAIVFVPAEPQKGGLSTNSPVPLPVATLNEDANQIGKGNNTLTDFTTSSKAALIRNAASYAMIPSSPAIDVVVAEAAGNWSDYLTNRLTNGLSPLDYLKSTLNDLSGYPQTLLDSLNSKVSDEIKQVGTKGADAVKKDLADWVKANVTDPKQQANLTSQLNTLVDDAASAGSSAAGGWVTSGINSVLTGPLSKYKDQISNWASGAAQGAASNAPGVGGGFSVDKALDNGFGADVGGFEGALLRSLRKLIYARMATVVTLHDAKTGELKTKFGEGDPIRARVTYLFYCQIPMVNKLAGKPFYGLSDQTVMAMTTGPLGPAAMVGIPGYFMTMTADHVLVNQGKP